MNDIYRSIFCISCKSLLFWFCNLCLKKFCAFQVSEHTLQQLHSFKYVAFGLEYPHYFFPHSLYMNILGLMLKLPMFVLVNNPAV